ncbi:MAG TPA: hypothetical protein VMV92_11565 [Streptosporangiaceae bacterium]|nr:hypothetical protein [Streptosporangiaceae bacterium]
MSGGTGTVTTGSPTAGAADGCAVAERADTAGRLLGRLTVLPALLVMAWLLAGLPLLMLGVFTPVLMLVVSVPLAVLLVIYGLRWIPGRWPDPLQADTPGRAGTPWWALAGVIVVAVAFGVDQMIYHSQQIIVMRDPASYIQFANWISHHHSLPIPQDLAAFGGRHRGVSFASFAFYQVGSTVVPQFMAGLPMILAGGYWIGGVAAAVTLGPVLGALSVLTFGGLAARLAGPRWAPLAALVLAISLPEEFTSRSTYSEPAVQILFLGGLCLVIDSFAADGAGARVFGALGGLALGLTLLVRIDGASDMLPVIPYCGLLLVGRRRQALPLLGGLVVGGIYGSVDGLLLSKPYLVSIKTSLEPLALVAAVVVVATGLAVLLMYRRGLPDVRGNWLPNAVAAGAFLVTIAFTLRPYVQITHGQVTKTTQDVIASFQQADHLPVDPTRLYYEISMHWVFWYIGVPAVVLGTIGAAVLSRRCLRGRAPTWTLPLMAFAWAIVVTLYRPAITPDQPWASRRLVPAVLPGFILLAVWATRWLAGWLREHDFDRVIRGGLVGFCLVALVVPGAMTTFGLGVKDGGPLGLEPTAVGLAFTTTYRGEIAAVNGLCAAIPRDASVVIIDGPIADRMTEVIRGTCDVPVARIRRVRPWKVAAVVRGIAQAGRRPVLLAARYSELALYGGPAKKIMTLRSTQDGHALVTPPTANLPLKLKVWMSEPPR